MKEISLKRSFIILILSLAITSCYDGEDVTGKIVIEYDGDWTAVITENYEEKNYIGTGETAFSYTNPDTLKAEVTKTDDSLNKLIVYIYEDERIAVGDSTREPEGSAGVEYEFAY